MIDAILLTIVTVLKIVLVLVPLILCVAYLTLAERKVIGSMQVRVGPNRVGFRGLGQPFADVFKLLCKEVIVPTNASRFLFLTAPILSLAPAVAAWAVMPFADGWVLADVNAGLLYVLAMTSLGVYGVIIAGWASNSKYAFLGAMRSAAQIVAYEIAMGFALIGVLMMAGSLNLGDIVRAQSGGFFNWYLFPLFPLAIVYFISGVAETNRVDYSGMAFALFFLAEYANMIMIAALAAVMFLGGWLSPIDGVGDGIHWFLIKTAAMLFVFLWLRATFPRYRYDQIMRLGWKIFIPVTIVWIAVVGFAIYFDWGPWFSDVRP